MWKQDVDGRDKPGHDGHLSRRYSDDTTGARVYLARIRSGAGVKFSSAPRLSRRPVTNRPFSPATISPLRKVGSSSTLIGARPTGSLPLQVQPATISLR